MINFKHLYDLSIKSIKAWSDDFAPSMGAAISYYTVFSLAPLLIIVIAMAGAVFGREAVQGQIVAQLGGLVGEQGASLIHGLIASASDTDKGLVAGLISFVVLIVGATTVFAELQSALDRIWHVPAAQKPQGIWGMLRARFLSFGLILGLVFLLIVSLAASAGVAAFGSLTSDMVPGVEVLLQVLNFVISTAIFTLLFAMIYKLMPTTHIEWRDVWVGAATTSVLFNVGKMLIGLYLGKSNMTESFAAAGSLVVLLVWVYYAAQIFLLGAEFTKVFADDHGSRAGQQVKNNDAVAATAVPTKEQPGVPEAAAPVPAVARLAQTREAGFRGAMNRANTTGSPAATAARAANAALVDLFTELGALVVVKVAASVVHKKRRTVQKRYGWRWPT